MTALPEVQLLGIQRRIARAILLPLILVLLLAGVLVWQVVHLLATTRWLDRMDRAILLAMGTQKRLLDMDSGLRGYALTGQTWFLEPYEAAASAIGPQMQRLSGIVADDALARRRVAQLQSGYKQWHQYAEARIAARQANAPVATTAQTAKGASLMDAMQSQVAELIADEQRTRQQRSMAARQFTQIVLALAIGVSLLLGLVLAWIARRQVVAVSSAYRQALQSLDRRTAALGESEARGEAIVNTAVDGIITIDPAGTILSFNPAAERLFGYARQEVIGQNVRLLMPSPDRENHDQYLSRYLQTGERRIIGIGREVRGLRKDGTTFPLDLSVSEVALPGRRLFTGIIRDVTERKRAEEQLRQAKERAEDASRAKDRFIATLSHELRTPLTPVLAIISALLEDSNLPQEFRADMEMIRRNVDLESRLIDDLLDLTSIAKGAVDLNRQTVNVHELLLDVIRGVMQEVRGKPPHVTTQFQAQRSVVYADPARLGQVFRNLLRNSVRFCPPVGQILVRTSDADAQSVRIEVADTGIGIEPATMSRLFEPFIYGQATMGHQGGGLGLGLTIARGLVEAHGGRLLAASGGHEQGATFTVELPGTASTEPSHRPSDDAPPPTPAVTRADAATPSSPPSVAEPTTPRISAARLRILLVEDHLDTLKTMTRLLRHFGYDVMTATDVQSAITALQNSGRFDLLVSDLGLPDGSGHDIMRQARAQYGINGIAISGYGMAEDIRTSHDAGFARHLTKPIDFQKLLDTIQAVSQRKAGGTGKVESGT